MPMFNYQGRDALGNSITGKLKTNSIDDVVAFLKKQNIIPLTIKPITPKKSLAYFFNTYQFNNTKDVMYICRQLGILTSAGVSIIKSLEQLAQATNKPILAHALTSIADDITAGKSFSAALQAFPKIFSNTVCNVIAIGENTGKLNEALLQLATYLETSIANHRRLMAALRYPTIVVIALIFVIIFMSLFVIPKFTSVYQSFTMQLPLPTMILLAISNFMLNHWVLLFIGIFGIIFTTRFLLSYPKIRSFWDQHKLRLPIIGNIQKRILLSQFTWTFALVLRSGIPIIQGLTLAGNAIANVFFQNEILQMRHAIEHGASFSQAAKASNIFLPTVLQMFAVGEESGHMDEVLIAIARAFEAEVDYDLKRLNELFEPLLLGLVGALVLGLALAIYLPIWNLVQIVNL